MEEYNITSNKLSLVPQIISTPSKFLVTLKKTCLDGFSKYLEILVLFKHLENQFK